MSWRIFKNVQFDENANNYISSVVKQGNFRNNHFIIKEYFIAECIPKYHLTEQGKMKLGKIFNQSKEHLTYKI